MANPTTLNLNSIVDINVEISPLAAPRRGFDEGLILGDSTHIDIATRLKKYDSLAAMAADSFALTDPEYIAAGLYFSQVPTPNNLWVATWNPLKGAASTVAVAAGGTGYAVGDILTVTQSGAKGATLRVATLAVTAVATVTIVSGGEGHSNAVGLATTVQPSGGTGCTITISAISAETIVQAMASARAKNYEWYACKVAATVANRPAKATQLLLAAWAETATPSTVFFFTTQDTDVPTNGAGNVFASLKTLLYSRTLGQYATTQGGSYPNNVYATAAIMGYAMGQNSGLANSAYTLKFKNEVGVATEPLDLTAVDNIEGNNGNVYLSYGNYYNIFEQGVMANGQFFDEVLNLDVLCNQIQLTVMDLLYGNPKVPQTDAGVSQIIHAINQACELSLTSGFLGPGSWTGAPLLNLNTGDMLPRGYLVQAEALSSQAQANREARESPSIYVAIKEAGAVHSVVIAVHVNR